MHEFKKNWEEKVILLCEIFYSAINELHLMKSNFMCLWPSLSNKFIWIQKFDDFIIVISLIESDTISIGQLIMTQKSPGTGS